MHSTIPEKTNKVLNIIILALLLILVRVWYLSIIQHDVHVEKSKRPKRRTVLEKTERATIRDRFNVPLALNKMQYNAAICYADIRQIPSFKWELKEGKRTRVPARTSYISQLSKELALLLQLDEQMIEDTIYAKASLFPHTPFVIKEDLTEEEYYRLKWMEKDWLGVRAERGSKRYYPLGKVGADIIGYMGSISSSEFYHIAQELGILQTYLSQREMGEITPLPKGFSNPLEVRERLRSLQEKAYTIHDLVGKSGVEGAFDGDLRGFAAKKTYEVDTKGNLIRELPGGRPAISGQRLLLSISAELQEFAEKLLIENEAVREIRNPDDTPNYSTPWIKGGAIVAMDPNTGEILALASYPRMDANDFIPSSVPEIQVNKQASIRKWLENEAFIAEIWDGKRPLEREKYYRPTDTIYQEKSALSLSHYLETILAPESQVFTAMQKITTVGAALSLQDWLEELCVLSGNENRMVLIDALYAYEPHRPVRCTLDSQEKKEVQQALAQSRQKYGDLKSKLDSVLGNVLHNDDKLLIVDLCRMLACKEIFSSEIVPYLQELPLSGYREFNQSAAVVKSYLQTQMKKHFNQTAFRAWRELHFKEYLKEKRKEEKEKKRYARPYTDYLHQIEKKLFETFWEKNHLNLLYRFVTLSLEEDEAFLLSQPIPAYIAEHANTLNSAMGNLPKDHQKKFLQTLRSFDQLTFPLYGKYRQLRNLQGKQLEKHLAASFYPRAGYGYGRSQAFRQSTPQGSVFKIVVAYQALLERHKMLKEQQKTDINPLTLIDNLQWHPKKGSLEQVLGYTLDGQPIKRLYKGGKLPRSSHPNIGKIDMKGAIEQSSNIYFSLLTADHIPDPLHLIKTCRDMSFAEKTGIELPGEIGGILPDDVTHNKTGLYAFAIGQHSLVVTPLQTAVMLSSIANKGKVLKPKVIQVIAGNEPLREYGDPFSDILYPFKDNLDSIGIHFPLFTAAQAETLNPSVWYNAPEIRCILPMPNSIHHTLMEGMHQVIVGQKGTARPNIIRALARNPEWMRTYQNLKGQLVGKTGTAEILYKQSIDTETEAKMQNHIWFGGIAFAEDDYQSWEKPELVVVVYLRFSEAGGKEATPLATELIKKFREIRSKEGRSAYVMSSE